MRGAEQFGTAKADEYSTGLIRTVHFLASYPRAARERGEIVPPVRAHTYKSHVLIYEVEGEDIIVLRVRHGHEDWASSPL